MRRRSSPRLLGDQRGQTTIFLALAMMFLVAFLAFMVNAGQLIHDRILIQQAADMIALSGANVQAAGLNEIADLNREIQKLKDDLFKDIACPINAAIELISGDTLDLLTTTTGEDYMEGRTQQAKCAAAAAMGCGGVANDAWTGPEQQVGGGCKYYSGCCTRYNQLKPKIDAVHQLADKIEGMLGLRFWESPISPQLIISYYSKWIDETIDRQFTANQVYAQGAIKVAQQTLAKFNQKYGQGGGSSGESPPGRRPYSMTLEMGTVYPQSVLAGIDHEKSVMVWYFFFVPTVWPYGANLNLDTWPGSPWSKNQRDLDTNTSSGFGIILPFMNIINGLMGKDQTTHTYFRVRLNREPVKPFISLDAWGFKARMPALEAYSLAQPTGGKVNDTASGGGKPSYIARFMPLRTQYNASSEQNVSQTFNALRDKFRH